MDRRDQEMILESVQGLSRHVESYKTDINGLRNDIEELRQKGLNAKSEGEIAEVKAQLIELKAKEGRFGFAGSAVRKRTLVDDLAKSFRLKHRDILSVNSRDRLKYDLPEGYPMGELELKAQGSIMTANGDLTGNSVTTYMSGAAMRGRRKIELRDLVSIIPSATGSFAFLSQNNPVGVGSIDFQTTLGSVKQQLEYQLTMNVVNCNYLSGFVRFPKQMAQDLPYLQNFLAISLVEDYLRQESGSFLPILAGAASASTGVNGATVYAEKIINWIANILANDYSPTAILVTAAEWATLLLTKPDNYSVPAGFQVDGDGTIRIAGVPVYVQNNMSTGKTICGDFSRVAIIQAEGLSCQFFEQDSDNVERNLLTARVEARVGLAVLRPDAFTYA